MSKSDLGEFVLIEETEAAYKTIIHASWIIDYNNKKFLWPPGSDLHVMRLVGNGVSPQKDWMELSYRRIVFSNGKLFSHIIMKNMSS